MGFLILCVVLGGDPPAMGQAEQPGPNRRIPRGVQETVRTLRFERRIVRASWLWAAASSKPTGEDPADPERIQAHFQILIDLATRHHVAALEDRQVEIRGEPGVVIHVHVSAIAPMSRIDLIWEGRPPTVRSLGRLIDQAIFEARHRGVLIERLTLTGHAGLPGCCALGSRLEDCVFNGQLSEIQKKQLCRLRPYLADDAVIELRQCGSAADEKGTALLTAIHRATRCTVLSYVEDFRFGFSAGATFKRIDAQGEIEIVEPER